MQGWNARPDVDTPSPAPLGRARRSGALRRWAPLGLALAVNLLVLYAPDHGAPSVATPGLDKVVHAVIFAAPAVTGLFAGLRPAWFVPALLAHAIASEIVQHVLLANRQGDPWDVVADVVGVLLGWAVAQPGGLSAVVRRPSGRGR